MASGSIKEAEQMKPVTVRVQDFKQELNKVVAESGLPPFLLEMILGEMLSGISIVAEREYEQDKEEWDSKCREGENNG
ncbi:MAG: hypothetical protein HFG92_13585 [Dorea sp.]|jgi:hypothetical protein|nr:hypothetical protein [Dorea sp.]